MHLKRKNNSETNLHLVDLAGHKSQEKAKTAGLRAEEGVTINQELIALRKTMSIMANNGETRHMLFSGSTLTRVLQEPLVEKMLLFMCVTEVDTLLEENVASLKFSEIVTQIKQDDFQVEQKGLQSELEAKARKIAAQERKIVGLEKLLDRAKNDATRPLSKRRSRKGCRCKVYKKELFDLSTQEAPLAIEEDLNKRIILQGLILE